MPANIKTHLWLQHALCSNILADLHSKHDHTHSAATTWWRLTRSQSLPLFSTSSLVLKNHAFTHTYFLILCQTQRGDNLVAIDLITEHIRLKLKQHDLVGAILSSPHCV